jgi:hypothetical protein
MLRGRALVEAAAFELNLLGFVRVSTNRDRTSQYLRFRGAPFVLRLSDHTWSRPVRERNPDVVCSMVLPPMIAMDVQEYAKQIVANFTESIRQRKEAQPNRPPTAVRA